MGVLLELLARYVAAPAWLCARHRARPAKSAASDRALPSGVRGPVLKPPWNLQRPLVSARHRQDPPARVRAPHALFGLCLPSATERVIGGQQVKIAKEHVPGGTHVHHQVLGNDRFIAGLNN